MKNLLRILSVLVLSSTLSIAKENPKEIKYAMYNVENSKILKVFIDNSAGQAMSVQIKDKDGNVISDQFVTKNTINPAFIFDLSLVSSGNYSLVIKSNSKIVEKEFKLMKIRKDLIKF